MKNLKECHDQLLTSSVEEATKVTEDRCIDAEISRIDSTISLYNQEVKKPINEDLKHYTERYENFEDELKKKEEMKEQLKGKIDELHKEISNIKFYCKKQNNKIMKFNERIQNYEDECKEFGQEQEKFLEEYTVFLDNMAE